jgi:hypothetical protein
LKQLTITTNVLLANHINTKQLNRLPKKPTDNKTLSDLTTTNSPTTTAIVDSGTTGHYFQVETATAQRQLTTTPIKVQLPDGATIESTHTCILDLPKLPSKAQEGHIFPKLANHALLSVAVLCDQGCEVNFHKNYVDITKDQVVLYRGRRSANGLWTLHISDTRRDPTALTSYAAIAATPNTNTSSTLNELINYLHAACFSPTKSTLIKAIDNGHFITWPGFTSQNVHKFLTRSFSTALGHLDQKRKNIQSSKPNKIDTKKSPVSDTENHLENNRDITAAPKNTTGKPEHFVYAAVERMYEPRTGQVFSDQTGAFPVISNTGSRYVMVVYDYDSNAILVEPLRNRQGATILAAYRKIHNVLKQHGCKPQLQRLDNEASTILKQFLHENEVEYQLVPPGIHRRNAAERAIRTWKNHFIAGLTSTDNNFPLHLWDKLIEQSVITLNLLRQSRLNPKLSAYSQLFGAFDFNKTPLAPPGTRVITHVKADARNSWATHGDPGWYIGPAMEHYRCYRTYITKTRDTRITDTVEFFPTRVPMPKLSSKDAARQAAQDLIHALKNPHPAAPVFYPLGAPETTALKQLADIFQTTTAKTHETQTQESKITTHTAAPRVETTHSARDWNRDTKRSKTPTVAPKANVVTQGTSNDTTNKYTKFGMPRNRYYHAAKALAQLPSQAIPNTKLQTLFEQQRLPELLPDCINAVIHPVTGIPMEYRQLIKDPATKEAWNRSSANEFGRLAQGVGGRVTGTDTIKFIVKSQVPEGRTVTYARFVCTIREQKAEPERTRLTVGGNLINYPGDTSAPTADLTTFKTLINSTLSTPNARMCCLDVKNYYLNTPMDRPEYMRIPLYLIPEEIINEYHLREKVHTDGNIYIEINKGMYGLPQAGILANKLLAQRIGKHGYYQCRHTPGLWRHIDRPITFALVVDDFAIKYVGREHAQHLLSLLQRDYEAVSEDWEATLFCGITLKWDYDKRICYLSMPGYIQAMLTKFEHTPPTRKQHAPHRYNAPNYGAKIQAPERIDNSATLTKDGITRIMKIVGTSLYYARAVDGTMLVTLSSLASKQAKATKLTNSDVHRFLDYCATHPDATLKYQASDMILKIHSDAGYLNESKGRSRAGGHFYLGNKDNANDINNGAILNPTGILKHVASSASEAELGALFVNCKEGVILRQTLQDMGHPQPTTPVQTDNSTASGIANDTLKQQRSRAMDMRYHWIRDRVTQKQFLIFWQPGKDNKGDYFTKHHSPMHHQTVRPVYLYCPSSANIITICPHALRGCVDPSTTSLGHKISSASQTNGIHAGRATHNDISRRLRPFTTH